MAVSAAQRAPASSPLTARGVWRLLTYALLIGGGVLYTIPFLWMARTSLMAVGNMYLDPPQVIPDPVAWENYRVMWQTGPFAYWLANSALVTGIAIVATTFTSALVAFGFARTRFPGRDAFFVLVLTTMMLPGHITIIPQFILFRQIQWLDTLLPIIVPDLFGSAFYIFVLRQFFLTLPLELDEAAEIDGAGLFAIFWRIVVPLSKPALATVAVFTFISKWNQFFEPLIFIRTPERLTLAVGINWFRNQYGTQFHLLMAASLVAVLPIIIIFFIAQKQFIRGIALTGMKS
jgi:ABC-type glycerol-3-phosphate transport system permease component